MDYIYFDLNGKTGDPDQDKAAWEEHANYVPSKFVRLVCQGIPPELAAELADDGLPISEPVDVAEDGGVVVEWPTMYEEAA